MEVMSEIQKMMQQMKKMDSERRSHQEIDTLERKLNERISHGVPQVKCKALVAKTEIKKTTSAEEKSTPAPPAKQEPVLYEYEKRIKDELIPAGEFSDTFQDIGALDNVKQTLQQLVMLPLRRPDLFKRGGLIKPCKGILLFGPPGTGKTMLAKAVATEARASFINVSMSVIASRWFGDSVKHVRALFTLAAKVAPTIIFIDEVDSMLGGRSTGHENKSLRKVKNEFMTLWDGLLTKATDQVLVMAATNRPFDLDEAIIRRFERRIMVELPNARNREQILRAILSKEQLSDNVDIPALANMTEGYSGSDLKNLCVAAAYRPISEVLEMELHKQTDEASRSFRPLDMEDIKQAKKQVLSSFSSQSSGMMELKEWNELYGDGGSHLKQQLTYFV